MSVFKLSPSCKNNLWGGNKLREFYHKQSDDEIIAETWELSAHPAGPSTIVTGPFRGFTLPEYIEKCGPQVLGTKGAAFPDFPVLVKLIDAKEKLSIQVHPNDDQARSMEGEFGKTEMWYILEADPEAFLYYGFKKTISKEEFQKRIEDGTLTEVLNKVYVKPGELYFIPAGTLHAIGGGIVIAEIQQSSNVTYRIFDYNRRGKDGKLRELHVEKAVAVTKTEPPVPYVSADKHLVSCPYFTVDHQVGPFSYEVDDDSFSSILVLDGDGRIYNEDDCLLARKGDCFFLPAGSGTVLAAGNLNCLITRV